MLTGPAKVIKIDQKLDTVALDTNVYDVFVFVLAHVLASLVAKSLRQDPSHAAQASKMNDCSGLIKLPAKSQVIIFFQISEPSIVRCIHAVQELHRSQ